MYSQVHQFWQSFKALSAGVLRVNLLYPSKDRAPALEGGVGIPHSLPWFALGSMETPPSRAGVFYPPIELLNLKFIRVDVGTLQFLSLHYSLLDLLQITGGS